jgi:hypothetical protein
MTAVNWSVEKNIEKGTNDQIALWRSTPRDAAIASALQRTAIATAVNTGIRQYGENIKPSGSNHNVTIPNMLAI